MKMRHLHGCLQEVPTIIIVLLSLEILELWIGGCFQKVVAEKRWNAFFEVL